MRLTERQRWEFLPALCVALWAGCANPASTQVISGRIAASDSATAVRALDGDTVVTAAQVRSDGSFALALPRGSRYRLEVLTAGGVKHLALANGGQFDELTFKVCRPAAPWDVGMIAHPQVGNVGGGCAPATDPYCKCLPDGTCTSPTGGGDGGGGGVPCDPATDPLCKCAPDGTCTSPGGGGGGGGVPCDPATDPLCKCAPDGTCTSPGGGDGGGGGGGGGVPCDPTTEPLCKCDANGNCTLPTTGGCDPATDPNCGPVLCPDPSDPVTCKDPCVLYPSTCGCPPGESTCWDAKGSACDAAGKCAPTGALTPEHPPGDFGCGELR